MIGAVRAPEVGYMFNANYWGKGYATEALKAFIPAFFDHYSGGPQGRFEYAVALTDPELVASQNVLQKVGFKLYEKREKDFDNPVLGWRDTLVYRIYRAGSADQDSASGTV
jgi:RimJ/RimL family protein N-acetyltransferase